MSVSLTDSYGTPESLTSRLPVVHLDPCSHVLSTVRASMHYLLERGQNGLELPWAETVFINWPYSDPAPWVTKLLAEVAAGRVREAIILPKHDHSTEWWSAMVDGLPGAETNHVIDQWQFKDRIQFRIPPDLYAILKSKHEAKVAAGQAKGAYKPSNNFCSSLLHWHHLARPPIDLRDVATLWRKAS